MNDRGAKMNDEYKSIEINRLIREIAKKWWAFLLAVIIFSAASYYFTTSMVTPIYRASSTIFIGRDAGVLSELTLSDINLGQKLAADYRELIMTNLVVQEVLARLPAEYRIVNIRGNLSVQVISDSRFMRISFEDMYPERATLIVNQLSEVLVEQAEKIVGVKNVQIVDYAQLPYYPIKPNLLYNVFIAGLLGFILAGLILLLTMMYRDTIQKQEDIEQELNLAVLGVIPKYKGNEQKKKHKGLIVLQEPNSFPAESYRIVRTNVGYLNVDSELKVLMFTSASAEEGKTNSTANLAATLASSGKRVLIIDCDLRKGRVHRLFNFPRMPGLTNCLANKTAYDQVINKVETNLHVLTSGALPPNPADILAGSGFEKLIDELKGLYDYILLDTAPVLAFADAAVISRVADGVVLIAAANETKKEDLNHAQRALAKVDARILGVLLTKAEVSHKKSYYSYHAVEKG